jgi:hypothetical protein
VGFKKISGGWLFSVAISDGVDIGLKSGKRFIVGSNDSASLKAAIIARMLENTGAGSAE